MDRNFNSRGRGRPGQPMHGMMGGPPMEVPGHPMHGMKGGPGMEFHGGPGNEFNGERLPELSGIIYGAGAPGSSKKLNNNRLRAPKRGPGGRIIEERKEPMKRPKINISNDELNKIKVITEFLFCDQYKDMASFLRFEECFGLLTKDSGISLEKAFSDICGEKKKYITFRRMIRAFSDYKNNDRRKSNDFKKFMKLIFDDTIQKDEIPVGNKNEGALKYNSKSSENHKAISKFSVITDEAKETIKGLEIYYDDFFKNNLYLNKEGETYYISLEINLAADEAKSAETKDFPDANLRDGITHIVGLIDPKDKTINLLGFKCRSGKVYFIGKPEGKPFLFGGIQKQLQSIKIEVNNGKLSYLEPFFMNVDRGNPFVNIKPEEISEQFLKQDKPIYEEEYLKQIGSSDLMKNILQPLVSDNAFKDPNDNDTVKGINYQDFIPLTKRFWFVNPEQNMPPPKGPSLLNDILNEAQDFSKQLNERKFHGLNKRGGHGGGPMKKKSFLGMLLNKENEKKPNEITTGDFLLNNQNYDNLLKKIGENITKQFEEQGYKPPEPNQFEQEEKVQEDRGFQSGNFEINSEPQEFKTVSDRLKSTKRKNNAGNDKLKANKIIYTTNNMDDLSNYFFNIRNNNNYYGYGNNYGYGYGNNYGYNGYSNSYVFDLGGYGNNYYGYSIYNPYQQQQQQKQEETPEIIKQKTQEAQKNWIYLYKKYVKDSGIFVLRTVGGVIKALTFLKNEEEGKNTGVSMNEKVRMYEILTENKHIINMLANAHKEALRRKEEQRQLEEDKEKLEELRREEERRQIEEKKRLEEEKKRIEEAERIAEEQKKIEEEQRKREEEKRKLEEQIAAENDRRRKLELQKQEEAKKAEEARKKAEEERKKKKLEEEKKRLEEEQRKAEEKRIKEEEARKKKEEEEKKKAEEEARRLEEEEIAQINANKITKELSTEDLPLINAKIEQIENAIKKYPNQKDALNSYYQELLKDRNAIIEALNNEQQKKLADEIGFNAEEALKKEEEERKKLKEEEDKKIEEKKKKEEEESKKLTKVVSVDNVQIPQGTKIWRNQKMAAPGTIYTDELFQPIKKNLCPVDKYGKWSFPDDITQDDVEGWENLSWARPEKIFNSENYQVFYEGVSKDDIIQGGLGDCYFLSAVAALCEYPELIEKLFYIKEKSKEHCYGCYYRINGIWQLVLIDDYFPCYGSWGKNFAFSSTNGKELWVVLLEKAWAKLNGSYAKAIGGEPHEVFDVITNAYSEKLRINRNSTESLWKSLEDAEKKNFIMTAGTSGDTYNLDSEEKGLVPGHAYTLLGVKKVGNLRLVHLRNPWGNTEWSGDYSDSSRKWTTNLKKECGFDKSKDDGSFWMTFEDFTKYFLVAGICHLYQDYVYTFLHVPKAKTSKGPVLSKLVSTTSNNHAYIMLHQKNPRIILKDGTFQNPVINYLMLVDKNNNYIAANYNIERNNCVSIDVVLDKDTYYLISDINFRYMNGQKQHCYNLSCYSKGAVGIYEENERDLKTTFKQGLKSYCEKNIQPKSFAGGKMYQSDSKQTNFPFNFCLFDNEEGPYDVTLTDTLKYRSGKCAEFYLEDNPKAESCEKTINSGDWDVFVHMPYTNNSIYSYSLQSSAKASSGGGKKDSSGGKSSISTPSSAQIQNELFKETPEELDTRGLLKQYVKPYSGGYYIGFENGTQQSIKMKLVLNGLYDTNNPGLSEIPFTSNGMSRKVFVTKIKEGAREVSFMFDYQ